LWHIIEEIHFPSLSLGYLAPRSWHDFDPLDDPILYKRFEAVEFRT